jgi:hypothetical protein
MSTHADISIDIGHKSESIAILINVLIALSEQARKEGLLALEESIIPTKILQRDILHTGLKLIVDGTDQEYMCNVLRNLAATNKKPLFMNKKFFDAYNNVIIDGCCSIQRGDNPRLLRLICVSHVPEKYLNKRIASIFLEECFNYETISKTKWIYTLEECNNNERALKLFNLPDSSIQELLRTQTNQDLVELLGWFDEFAEHSIWDVFLRNMSPKAADDLKYEIRGYKFHTEDNWIAEASKIKIGFLYDAAQRLMLLKDNDTESDNT